MTAADGSAHVGLRSFVPMIPVWAAFLLVFIGLRAASSTREVESLRPSPWTPRAAPASRTSIYCWRWSTRRARATRAPAPRRARSANPTKSGGRGRRGGALEGAGADGHGSVGSGDQPSPRRVLFAALIDRFGGDIDVALAAYFKGAGWVATIGGPPAVHRWLEKPSDVTLYVTRIRDLADRMRTRAGVTRRRVRPTRRSIRD